MGTFMIWAQTNIRFIIISVISEVIQCPLMVQMLRNFTDCILVIFQHPTHTNTHTYQIQLAWL